MFAADDEVIQCGRKRGTALSTGTEFDILEVHRWTVRYGKVVAAHFAIDTAAMLEALGALRMSTPERVEYDEFGLFHENAAEYGLPFDGPPTVRREHVEVEADGDSARSGCGEPANRSRPAPRRPQNAHTWDTVAMAMRLLHWSPSTFPVMATLTARVSGNARSVTEERGRRHRRRHPGNGHRTRRWRRRHVVRRAHHDRPQRDRRTSVRTVLLVDVLPGLKAEHARHIVDFVNGPATFRRFDDLLARSMEFNPTRRSCLRT